MAEFEGFELFGEIEILGGNSCITGRGQNRTTSWISPVEKEGMETQYYSQNKNSQNKNIFCEK